MVSDWIEFLGEAIGWLSSETEDPAPDPPEPMLMIDPQNDGSMIVTLGDEDQEIRQLRIVVIEL